MHRCFKPVAIFILLLLTVVKTDAQEPVGIRKQRFVIILNGSISMEQGWMADTNKYEAATRFVERLMDSVYKKNDKAEFALYVYGHQFPAVRKICLDAKREVDFSKDNRAEMALRMESLKPKGVSPVAYGIKMAMDREMEAAQHNDYTFILVTDGDENCNGDNCETVHAYEDRHIPANYYIVCMEDYQALQQYICFGPFLLITREREMRVAVDRILKETKFPEAKK